MNLDLVWSTLGIILICLLMLTADKLLGPIKGRPDYDLTGEKFSGFFRGLGNKISEICGVPTTVPVENTYSVFSNLVIPFLFVCISLAIACFVFGLLMKTMIYSEDLLINKVFNGVLGIAYLGVMLLTIRIAWFLFVLNLKVLFASVIGFVLIASLIYGWTKSRVNS